MDTYISEFPINKTLKLNINYTDVDYDKKVLIIQEIKKRNFKDKNLSYSLIEMFIIKILDTLQGEKTQEELLVVRKLNHSLKNLAFRAPELVTEIWNMVTCEVIKILNKERELILSTFYDYAFNSC